MAWSIGTRRVLLVLVALLLLAGPVASAQTEDDFSSTTAASVDDDELEWNETTTVRGTGWAPGSRITVRLYAGAEVLAEPTAGSDGSFTASLTIPSGKPSSEEYVLAVQGVGGDGRIGYEEIPVTILGPTPTQSIASDELGWNETTTVTGERYDAGTDITISLFPNNTVLAEVTADGSNRFEAEITIPEDLTSSQDYYLAVIGVGIDKIFHFDTIQISILGPRPVVELGTEQVRRGDDLDVRGRLFFAGSDATITLLPGYEELAAVPVTGEGTFDTTVTIPEGVGGRSSHEIVVTGQGADGLFAYVRSPLDVQFAPGQRADATVPTESSTTTAAPGPDLEDPELEQSASPGPAESDSNLPLLWIALGLMLLMALILALSNRKVRDRLLRRT